MVEFAWSDSLVQAQQLLIIDIGSIVHRNELLPGRDRTGQVLALSHRAHPDAVIDLLKGYAQLNPKTISGNLSAFVGYWIRKAQEDIDAYIRIHPYL
jgi:hypothetical protein